MQLSASQFWSNGARGYLKYQEGMRPLSAEVTRLIEATTPKDSHIKILDIGCGAGEPSCILAQTFPKAEVHATDFAPGMLDVASEYAAKRNVKHIKYSVADAQDLSQFETGSMDVITCVATIFMVPDPHKAVKEFKRVLKPGGRALVTVWSTPNEMQFATVNFATMGRILGNSAPPPAKFNFTDPDVFKSIFPACGFSEVSISDFNLVFKFSMQELEHMGDHPMSAMILSQLVQQGKVDEQNAWPFFFKELRKTLEEGKYLGQDDIATLPKNRAFIANAIA